MTANFVIRPMVAGDEGGVAALFRIYAGSLGVDLGYQGFENEVQTLPGAYAPPGGALLIAVAMTGEPLGCVGVRPMDEPGTCEMKRLHVNQAARGMGIGRALAVAAIEAATRAGYAVMRLDTLPSMGTAQGLYRRLGFETTPGYYDTPVAGTIFMRKRLIPRGSPAGE